MATVPKRNVRTELIDDPRHLGRPFAEMQQAYDRCDYSRPMRQALNDIAQDHRWGFTHGRAPSGEPWAPLKPSTIAKKGHGIILVETGALDESLSMVGGPGNVAEVSDRGLIFGTRDTKSPLLNAGTSKMPARPHVGLAPERADLLAEVVADHLVEQLKG